MHWRAHEYKIGLNENLTKFREIQEFVFSDRHTYFVTYVHTYNLVTLDTILNGL